MRKAVLSSAPVLTGYAARIGYKSPSLATLIEQVGILMWHRGRIGECAAFMRQATEMFRELEGRKAAQTPCPSAPERAVDRTKPS